MTDPARREPVADAGWAAAAATMAVGALVGWLARRGLLLPDAVAAWLTEGVAVALVSTAGAASSLVGAYWARRRVTPWPLFGDPADERTDEADLNEEPTSDVPVVEIVDRPGDPYPPTVEIPVVRGFTASARAGETSPIHDELAGR